MGTKTAERLAKDLGLDQWGLRCRIEVAKEVCHARLLLLIRVLLRNMLTLEVMMIAY